MNKRDFVLGGCSTLVGGVAMASPAEPLSSGVAPILGRLQRLPDLQTRAGQAEWQKYVDERFVQATPAGSRELVLRRVDGWHPDELGDQFSLLFATAGGPDPATSQALRHVRTGQQLQIFLQSAGIDQDGSTLVRADFNCLI
jgi:hypothetical protein